ncbi:hypothetical protein HDU96_008172 [Phlyctochytrium bullatum]|nr:hypothetical protein HDU96_008172 [Phlyctochytrium bullatum]
MRLSVPVAIIVAVVFSATLALASPLMLAPIQPPPTQGSGDLKVIPLLPSALMAQVSAAIFSAAVLAPKSPKPPLGGAGGCSTEPADAGASGKGQCIAKLNDDDPLIPTDPPNLKPKQQPPAGCPTCSAASQPLPPLDTPKPAPSQIQKPDPPPEQSKPPVVVVGPTPTQPRPVPIPKPDPQTLIPTDPPKPKEQPPAGCPTCTAAEQPMPPLDTPKPNPSQIQKPDPVPEVSKPPVVVVPEFTPKPDKPTPVSADPPNPKQPPLPCSTCSKAPQPHATARYTKAHAIPNPEKARHSAPSAEASCRRGPSDPNTPSNPTPPQPSQPKPPAPVQPKPKPSTAPNPPGPPAPNVDPNPNPDQPFQNPDAPLPDSPAVPEPSPVNPPPPAVDPTPPPDAEPWIFFNPSSDPSTPTCTGRPRRATWTLSAPNSFLLNSLAVLLWTRDNVGPSSGDGGHYGCKAYDSDEHGGGHSNGNAAPR